MLPNENEGLLFSELMNFTHMLSLMNTI